MTAVTTAGRSHLGRGGCGPASAVITLVAVLSCGETRTRGLVADQAVVVRENRSRTTVEAEPSGAP